jgi:peroxiredoxin
MLHPTLLPGTAAPRFTLPDQRGAMRSLEDYFMLGPVLLAFHRGTW